LSKQTRTRNELFSEPVDRQAVNRHYPGSEIGNELALVHSINSKNNKSTSDGINMDEPLHKFSEKQNEELRVVTSEQKMPSKRNNTFTEPELSEVQTFFHEQGFPGIEAEKFHNYFSSNGWLVGGKTKMKNWKAAARNWQLNSKRFNASIPIQTATNNLNAAINKSYQEKL
jgi:hypothetical protein